MSLKFQPLLVLKGVDTKPLHGCYATQGKAEGAALIHEGLDDTVIITFDDANRHLMTVGATGSRKTTSVQAPAVLRLIETGCSGLVVDVKGEYRHLADEFPDKVLVIGADDDAAPYNLIQGMSDEQFVAFLNENRTIQKEPYWGAMGVQDAKFVRKTYQLMGTEPTLADIVDALKEPQMFVRSCDAFVKCQTCLPNDYMSLLKAVRSNRFSILAMGESQLLDIDAPGMEDVQKQYSWQTNGLINVLAPFSVDQCLRAKFSPKSEADESEAHTGLPSMEDLLYRDRKVLLMDVPVDRFGSTAHVISKLMRIRMISAITGFRRQKQIGCGEDFYTFFAADEYQHLISVDQESNALGLYDDTAFFDRCRGYGHINLIATQSISALQARSPTGVAIDCLLQNIGTLIVFSSADPATDRLLKGRVSAMDEEQISSVVRSDLPAGHAYVVGRALRRHGNATLVSRVKATAIPGAPHMSRYFAGMPEPKRVPAFSTHPDYVTNPFHDWQAQPPRAGSIVIRRSFNERLDRLLEKLASSKVQIPPSDTFNEVIMEDADYRIALEGRLKGPIPTLWQDNMNLVIATQDPEGWSCTIPMNTVMPIAEEFMAPSSRNEWEDDPIENDVTCEQTIGNTGEASVEVWLPVGGELPPFDNIVKFFTGGAQLAFPKNYWNQICYCLWNLDSRYREAALEGYDDEQEADLFDDFFEDE